MRKVEIKKNRYVDSVTLMGISARAMQLSGVENAEAGMATPANRQVLEELGYALPPEMGPNDLMLAVTAGEEQRLEEALRVMRDALDRGMGTSARQYHDLNEIDLQTDPYDLVQISLPGEHAAQEAEKALRMGLEVFIFSDNVPLEQELALKELGWEKNLLVMGPDCGVGLMKGVALAAGSVVRPGCVGIVGASGSGAQEVACLVERCGLGVSSLIGTGGRDLYPQIGGITMKMGMKRLEEDPETQVVVLVSKLADLRVMEEVLALADTMKKPVVAVFLGSEESLFVNHRAHGAFSLEDAALQAVELVTGTRPRFGLSDEELEAIAESEVAKYTPQQKYFRGLYCGGTFTEESLIYFHQHNSGAALFSNLSTRYAEKLADYRQSRGHTILDLGAEDFTAEAPHPVFDPTLRLKRLRQELADPEVAVVLLDFITGPGLHPDPVGAFCAICKEEMQRRKGAITFLTAVCGAAGDPQNVEACRQRLRDAGAIVTDSNAQSTRLASRIMARMEEGGGQDG